jgi:hypothetical protein
VGERPLARLDELRRMLFPRLSPEKGWARVDAAARGQSDPERWAAIERIVAVEQLHSELRTRLRQLRATAPASAESS